MKTIIDDNVFIVKFSYEKNKTQSEYACEILRKELAYAEACFENEKKPVKERVKIAKPEYQSYGQRTTNCHIIFGKVDEKEMRGTLADVSVINHPKESFTFASGRKHAFKLALDIVLKNDGICDMVGITKKHDTRKQFMNDFFQQCPTSFRS